MNRFAQLLDRLAYEPGRNNKLRLLTAYFREVEDPDRGYALAALTGALSFKHAKPGLIRDLITERTDPVLFALSYDYVGDLSETVALMWPKGRIHREESLLGHPPPQPSPTRGEGAKRNPDQSTRRESRAALTAPTTPLPPRSGGEGSGVGGGGGGGPVPRTLQPAFAWIDPPPPTPQSELCSSRPRHARCAWREGRKSYPATTTRRLQR
jgi:DNA ligase-1